MTHEYYIENILIVGADTPLGQATLAACYHFNNQLEHSGVTQKTIRPALFCCFHQQNMLFDTGAIHTVFGKITNNTLLSQAMQGKDGVVCATLLTPEEVAAIVKAAAKHKIKRLVFLSTVAAQNKNSKNRAGQQQAMAAEALMIGSKTNWTIVRTTPVYGPGLPRYVRLVRHIRKWPVLLVPGSAHIRHQPTFVEDAARAFIQAYMAPAAKQKTYVISGQKPLSFRKMAETVATILGKKVFIVEIKLMPLYRLMKKLAPIFPSLQKKADYFLYLNEHKAAPHSAAANDFGYTPTDFHSGIHALMQHMEQKTKEF